MPEWPTGASGITSSTTVYDIQRSAGLIDFEAVPIGLPVTKPVR